MSLLKTQLFQHAWTIIRRRCDWTASSAPHTNIRTQLKLTFSRSHNNHQLWYEEGRQQYAPVYNCDMKKDGNSTYRFTAGDTVMSSSGRDDICVWNARLNMIWRSQSISTSRPVHPDSRNRHYTITLHHHITTVKQDICHAIHHHRVISSQHIITHDQTVATQLVHAQRL